MGVGLSLLNLVALTGWSAALASLALFLRTAQMLRGFELTGWLVMVLQQNIIDMMGFMALVSIFLLFFTISFMMLFHGEMAEDPDFDGRDFSTLSEGLMNAFVLGVFGDVELTTFEDDMRAPTVARILFIVFMVLVGVVSLNALIAFLGDSYAKVQERQVEATLTLKAGLIVEYYNALGPFAAMRERAVAWCHVLRVVKDEDPDEAWRGSVNQIKDAISSSEKTLKDQVDTDLAGVRKDLANLTDMMNLLGKRMKIDFADTARPAEDEDEEGGDAAAGSDGATTAGGTA